MNCGVRICKHKEPHEEIGGCSSFACTKNQGGSKKEAICVSYMNIIVREETKKCIEMEF